MRQTLVLPAACLALVVASCFFNTEGIPCQSDLNCPTGKVCTDGVCTQGSGGGTGGGGGGIGGGTAGGGAGGAGGGAAGGDAGGTAGGIGGGSAGGDAGGAAGGTAGGAGGGTSGGAGGGTAGGSGGAGGGGVGTDGGPPDAGSCDPSEVPQASGIFVSVSQGNDTLGTGSSLSPVQTIGRALALAAPSDPAVIYLDEGTYPEAVSVTSRVVTVNGGWAKTGAQWTRDCSPQAKNRTLLSAPPPVALTVTDAGASLRTMTVTTLAPAAAGANQPGGSSIGVLVRGASVVELVDLVVQVPAGGAGGVASAGSLGGQQPCLGVVDCGSGAVGASASPSSASASTGGVFGPGGFTPGNGAAGTLSGNPGSNGTAGLNGASHSGCYTQCSCGASNCAAGTSSTVVAQPGRCGCAGAGGSAGAAGRGGGASVGAVVVGATAELKLVGSSLQSSNGGDGAPGGPGGMGGTGAGSSRGADATCNTQGCQLVNGSCPNAGCYYGGNVNWVGTVVSGGAAGGVGGNGGKGQNGGGGAGGPSHAVVLVGGAMMTLDRTTLNHGIGGTGAGGAPDGGQAPALTVP